jgi:TolB-like protein/Tfp pilus assembly protein PilF
MYEFENFLLDPERHELRRGARVIPIEPQVFDILEYLIRNRERVVSKDDLIEAVWNGRTISDSTLSSRITTARQAVADRGKEQRLIRTIARKGFRFVGEVRERSGSSTETAHAQPVHVPRISRKPTIAVLPFANISQDPEQQPFVDGLVEDITTELSRFCWLSVMARRFGFTHERWAVDIKQARRGFGVHYLLDISVRRAGDRVRVTASLIDTTTETHLWAQRYDARHNDVFSLQDQITTNVVGAIGPKLEQVEIERARQNAHAGLGSVDYYLRGMGNVYKWSRDGINDALSQFHKAIHLDPGFASAYGMAAYCYVQRKSYGWIVDQPKETAECARLAYRTAELAQGDGAALAKAAHAIASVARDIDSGTLFIERALKLNPSLAGAWYVSGWIRLFRGEPRMAIEYLTRAIQLGPCDPLTFKMHAALAYAHFFEGRYDDASTMAANALRTRPNYLTAVRAGAASHALAGRLDKARNLMTHMHKRDPALRISNLMDLLPFFRSQDFTRWAGGLHKAGLPD